MVRTMKQVFKVNMDVKQYEDMPIDAEDCVNNALHNYFRSLEQDGEIESYALTVEEVEQPTVIRVWELIMSQFEVGKKYEIFVYDEDNGTTRYKCTALHKDGGNLKISVFETDGEPDEGETWINWKWMTQIKAIDEEGKK